MDLSDWQLEMHRLLSSFERESTSSLRQIKRCFEALGRPFDGKFRQYFMELATQRLDSSFDTVLIERSDENTMQMTVNDDERADHTSTPNLVNMDGNGYQLEMHRLFSSFERESTSSLRQIKRCSVALGWPFDQNFRLYFMTKATLRLNLSLDSVFSEQCDGNGMQMTVNDDEMASNTNDTHLAVESEGPENAFKNVNVTSFMIENTIDATIEISDTDDDSAGKCTEGEAMATNDAHAVDEHMESNAQQDAEKADTNPDIESYAERNSEIGNEIELMDLPMVELDSNKENESVVNSVIDVLDLTSNPSVPSSLSSGRKQVERSDEMLFKCKNCKYTSKYKGNVKSHQLIHVAVKPFKCEHCDYATRQKSHLIRHQRTHDHQKLMGVVQDPNSGLFKCILCEQQFSRWKDLKQHLTLLHKDNQRYFNCMHCMRRFKQKSEKDRHELQCGNRRYKCFSCKKYVTRKLAHMRQHMRTHTGAKPFECAICNKCFRHKCILRRHLKSIHMQA